MTAQAYTIDIGSVTENVPACLRERLQWVAWRYVERNGEMTKVPVNPKRQGNASSTAPATWGTFEQAIGACQRCDDLAGVGYMFSADDPYCGIDLDDCRDPETEEIKPWADAIINRLDSYTEISPSGRGVKIFVQANSPGSRCRTEYHDGEVEVYDCTRYFTFTGLRLRDSPGEVTERQDELAEIYATVFGSNPEQAANAGNQPIEESTPNPFAPNDDDDVIQILERSKIGQKFKRLWAGQWQGGENSYRSQSEADLALVSYLAFMCGADPQRIDRLFRRSGMGRDKWDRDDYRKRTIDKALENKTQFYRPNTQIDDDFEWNVASMSTNNECTASNDVVGGKSNLEGVQSSTPVGRAKPLNDPVEKAKSGQPYPTTDLGNAERLAALYGSSIRYVAGLGWYVWDKSRWCEDDTGEIMRLSGKCIRNILREAAASADAAARADDESAKARFTDAAESLTKWARGSESASRIKAMVELARAQSQIAIRSSDLDSDPWNLNCLNGTIDLRTGILNPHDRSDLITKLAPAKFDLHAMCPIWDAFLDRIFDYHESLKAFVQRALGYALTGVIREHVVHVLYGTGANGKSTLLETVAAMMGDYATTTAPRLLVQRKGESHPTELADLRGARFVSSIETAEGGVFDEERVKGLSGGDRVKARKMRQDFFQFHPTFKLFLATNHRPVVRGDDNGIWRRIRLWPFVVEIPLIEQNDKLKEELLLELSGILAWCVRGCVSWQESGLCEPEEVRSATQTYRDEQDHFGDWFSECCLTPEDGLDDDTFHCSAALLYQSYVSYSNQNGAKPLGGLKFKTRLCKRDGITRDRKRTTTYMGVKLTDEAFEAAQGHGGGQWGGHHAGE